MAIPDQLQKGHTYADGDVVNAATLNALVDQAEVLKGAITEQSAVSADPADYVLIIDSGTAGTPLKKALVSTLPGAGTVTSVGISMPTADFNVGGTNPVIAAGTFNVTWKSKTANYVFAGPASGGTTTPAFRAMVPADTASVVPITAYAINCELGNVFTKTLPDNTDRTFTFTAGTGTPGQRIMVYVQQHGTGGTAEVHWAAGSGTLQWPGGDEPVMSTGASHRDIFEFVCISNNAYHGIRWGEDMLL